MLNPNMIQIPNVTLWPGHLATQLIPLVPETTPTPTVLPLSLHLNPMWFDLPVFLCRSLLSGAEHQEISLTTLFL